MIFFIMQIMVNLKHIYLRFYEELNDFLPANKRKINFAYEFIDRTSIKDLIESLGVPHTEVDLILVNGKSVDFNYQINDGDKVSVYPIFESFDINDVQHLRAKPLREPKFVADNHLGKLASYMRMAGFDTLYADFEKKEIINTSLVEQRTILTRDIELLKNKKVTHGYFVRSINPEEQLKEVIKRFNLENEIKEFSRCMVCNNILSPVSKEEVENKLPLKVKEFHNLFTICNLCGRIYWKGTHHNKMSEMLIEIKKELREY